MLPSVIYCIYRSTVMKILREVDPEGVKLRRKRRLKRRIYNSKVIVYHKD